jgi:hypothetical protein
MHRRLPVYRRPRAAANLKARALAVGGQRKNSSDRQPQTAVLRHPGAGRMFRTGEERDADRRTGRPAEHEERTMSRTHRNAMTSLIAALALSLPALATTEMDKLMVALDSARQHLNAHRENVQTLEVEIEAIRKEVAELKQRFEEDPTEENYNALTWPMFNLERHVIRLAEEQAAVLEWSAVVERLMAEIARLDAEGQSPKGEKDAK